MDVYDQDKFTVNSCALVFYLIIPFVTPISNYVIDTYKNGLKIGVSIGSFLLIVSTSVRLLINYGFGYVILGQIIGSLGIPFILASPSKVAANWFKPKSRSFISIILSFCVALGNLIGVVLPPLYVKDDSDQEKQKDQIFQLLLVEFIITTSIMVVNLIFFKGQPKLPPSATAQNKQEPFVQTMKIVLKNKNYLILFATNCLLNGSINGFLVVIKLVNKPFGFGSQFTSNVLVTATICGIIGTLISGQLIKKNKNFKAFSIIEMIFSNLFYGYIIFLFLTKYEISGYIILGLFGFFFFPILPILIEFGSEVIYPVGEATAAGYLFAGAKLSGFLFGLILTAIVKEQNELRSYMVILITFISGILALIIMCFSKLILKRQLQEIKSTLNSSEKVANKVYKSVIKNRDSKDPTIKSLIKDLETKEII